MQTRKLRIHLSTAHLLLVFAASTLAQVHPPASGMDTKRGSFSEFEVATIKPSGLTGHFGFRGLPTGKVDIGQQPLSMLVALALNVQQYQVVGGPDWAATDRYDLVAQPAVTDSTRLGAISYTPDSSQQMALRKLLADRFRLRFHTEKRLAPVYFLTRGIGPLAMEPAKDRTRPKAASIMDKGDKIDGEAFGLNTTIANLAQEIGGLMDRPVIDQTGIMGSYDFHLLPFDSSNTDMNTAIFKDMERLGLKLKPGKGLVETVVIDSASRPTPN